MEYPHGHGRHTHHSRRNDDDEDYPQPPSGQPPFFDQPPPYGGPPPFFDQPGPPHNQSYYREDELHQPPPFFRPPHHHSDYTEEPPPSSVYQSFSTADDYPPPPPPASEESEHHFRPHLPSFLHHHHTNQDEDSNKPTYKIYCKAQTSYSLTVRDGTLVVAPSDPKDPYQHWFKDEKYSTRVKDKDGFPGFAIVNKPTALALKNPLTPSHPIELTPYNADTLDQSVLWTESKDQGEGYRVIRTVKDTHLNLDASTGGSIRDGTPIILAEWKKRDNQRFKIVPY